MLLKSIFLTGLLILNWQLGAMQTETSQNDKLIDKVIVFGNQEVTITCKDRSRYSAKEITEIALRLQQANFNMQTLQKIISDLKSDLKYDHYEISMPKPVSLITEGVDKQDEKGLTALHLAVQKGKPEEIDALLAKDASPNVETIAGDNALTFALLYLSLSLDNPKDWNFDTYYKVSCSLLEHNALVKKQSLENIEQYIKLYPNKTLQLIELRGHLTLQYMRQNKVTESDPKHDDNVKPSTDKLRINHYWPHREPEEDYYSKVVKMQRHLSSTPATKK